MEPHRFLCEKLCFYVPYVVQTNLLIPDADSQFTKLKPDAEVLLFFDLFSENQNADEEQVDT